MSAATRVETAPATSPAKTAPKKPRRRGMGLFGGVLLLAGAAFCLPAIIANTSLRNHVIPLVEPALPEGMTIGSASLWWWEPVVLRDVRAPDLERRPMLTVGEARLDRTLWDLVSQPSHIGDVHLGDAALALVTKPGGSNLGDVLARFPAGDSSGGVNVTLHLQRGTIQIADEAGTVLSRFSGIEGQLELDGGAGTTALVVSGKSETAGGGAVEAAAQWTNAKSADTVLGPGSVRLAVERFPLDSLRPLLAGPLDGAAFAGDVTGTVDSRWDALNANGGSAELTIQIGELNAAIQPADGKTPPQQIVTHDASLRLKGTYDAAQDRLELSESALRSEWASGSLAGSISDLRTVCRCDIAGELACDLQPVLDQLSPELRRDMQISGLKTQRLALRGPLCPAEGSAESLQLETDLSWVRAAAYGVRSDNARLTVAAGNGMVRATPIEVPVSGGRLVSVPVLLLGPQPRLKAEGGILLERVAFSEEMCRTWMRYLSPLMANATTVQGSFSLGLNPAEFPVDNLSAANLAGTLAIHNSRVGPGPMTRDVLGLVKQIRAIAEQRPGLALRGEQEWLNVAEQNVPFEVRNGRVYHSNLVMTVGKVEVRSSGSVGLDETLDLLLEISPPAEWGEKRLLLAALGQDALRVPIRGTFSQPRVEVRSLVNPGALLNPAGREGKNSPGTLLKKLLGR